MKAKSSAHYQREYRKRLREQGLVKSPAQEPFVQLLVAEGLTAIEVSVSLQEISNAFDAFMTEAGQGFLLEAGQRRPSVCGRFGAGRHQYRCEF